MNKLLIVFTIISFFSYSEGDFFESTPGLRTNKVQKIINASATLIGLIKVTDVNTSYTSHGFVYSKYIFLKLNKGYNNLE
jgi:hypothetical protein